MEISTETKISKTTYILLAILASAVAGLIMVLK